jgi:hypothetical protein
MRFHDFRSWVETLRQSESSAPFRRGRRNMPGVEMMEGRTSLSALPAVQRVIPAFNPQPDPPARRHPAQVSRVGSIGMMTMAAVHRPYEDPNE